MPVPTMQEMQTVAEKIVYGAFEEAEFYVSDNADHFPEEPYVRCLFKKEKQAQRVEGDKIRARYVLVRNMSEVSGNDFGSAADIAVILAK